MFKFQFTCFNLCFDEGSTGNEVSNEVGDESATANQNIDAGKQLAPQDGDRTFTQDEVNKFLASDRRQHQDKYKQLETTYQAALQNKTLANEDRIRLEKELEDLQASFRTKEQQIEFERKQAEKKYEDELAQTKTQLDKWQKLYKEETIDRALLDAAGVDAFQPAQIASLLRPNTQLKDEVDAQGKPTGKFTAMVDFQDIDEKTGEPIRTLRTPQDAVKRMKELKQLYGNLFKSNVVSGVGAGSADSVPNRNQQVDISNLTPEQYRKIRKENPEMLGLAKKY